MIFCREKKSSVMIFFSLCSLTGRPSANAWPAGISISRESFANRSSKQPRELCPYLCEYSNDLLAVSETWNSPGCYLWGVELYFQHLKVFFFQSLSARKTHFNRMNSFNFRIFRSNINYSPWKRTWIAWTEFLVF